MGTCFDVRKCFDISTLPILVTQIYLINYEKSDDNVQDAPVVDLKIADTSSDESLEATQVVQIVEENNEDEEIIVPEAVKQIEEDEGEEIEAPEKAIAIEEEGEKIISDSEPDEIKQVEVEQPNAFDVKSDGNIDINEDIKYEPPKEYTGVKTEVLDLSDINKEE